MSERRALDVIFFLYFASHIPISLFVDFQSLLPQTLYPQQLIAVKEWYCREFRDAMMADPPGWFKSLILCELTLQFPFFFIATYGFFKGAKSCKWLRWPCVVYGTHVATTLVPIIFHVLTHDFSLGAVPGPRTTKERLTLISFYTPYFLVPVLLVVDALFSMAYRQDVNHSSGKRQSKKIR